MSKRENYGVGSFLHVYNRGAGKSDIFFEPEDYERFLVVLYLANSSTTLPPSFYGNGDAPNFDSALRVDRGETVIDICGYALLPNHFHLLVREKETGGTTKFMRRLATAHTMYVNAKYERSGCVFQGKFKSKTADENGYLQHLVAYVHANPADLAPNHDPETRQNFLAAYRYSSFPDLAGAERAERAILSPVAFDLAGDPLKFKWRVLSYKVRP